MATPAIGALNLCFRIEASMGLKIFRDSFGCCSGLAAAFCMGAVAGGGSCSRADSACDVAPAQLVAQLKLRQKPCMPELS